MPHVYNDIYKIVQTIPKGRVLTYGLISHMIGGRMSAQGVGWALKALGSAQRTERSTKNVAAKRAKSPQRQSTAKTSSFDLDSVPWQRVVNSRGGTSTHKIADIPPGLQQHILESEGVIFDEEGKLDLNEYLWMEGVKPESQSSESKRKPAKRK